MGYVQFYLGVNLFNHGHGQEADSLREGQVCCLAAAF